MYVPGNGVSDGRKDETYMSRHCAAYDESSGTKRRERSRQSCLEDTLNLRMPNGKYGGVRGGRKSPLLDIIRRVSLTFPA